jgi:alginate O-acetyltransferase complex protein AlgI
MSFLSAEFGIFLALGLVIFYLSPAHWRPRVLLGLSYVFYATWSLPGTVLLLAITMGVYLAARSVENRSAEKSKFVMATMAVAGLLVVLAVFKFGFLLAGVFSARSGSLTPGFLLIAPLGLSYYLFKAIGYLLDVYWEAVPAQRDFVSLALYLSFFPQIVSGPIQRAGDFLDQYKELSKPDPADFVIGLRRILFGMLKKVVIADRLGLLVATTHSHPSDFSSLELLMGAWCYSFQLYADFSGITDIAIGLGLLFGIRGPENFDLPYFASNIQVFWRRWHMSLTSWLTDYLFLPLRMSLRGLGTSGLCLAILINMLAIGLWHGARWTYAAFGAVNGVFMIVSALTLKGRNKYFQNHSGLARIRVWAGPLLTFHLIVFTHIFFSADSLRLALAYIAGIFRVFQHIGIPAWRLNWTLLGLSARTFLALCAGLAAMEAIHWGAKQNYWRNRFTSAPRSFRWGLYYASILILAVSIRTTVTFIYAQF